MDPSDDSITGTMKYLVYRRRKHLDFTKEMIALRYTALQHLNPDDAIKSISNDLFPEDPQEKMIRDLMQAKLVKEESNRKIVVVKDEHGSIRLKIK